MGRERGGERDLISRLAISPRFGFFSTKKFSTPNLTTPLSFPFTFILPGDLTKSELEGKTVLVSVFEAVMGQSLSSRGGRELAKTKLRNVEMKKAATPLGASGMFLCFRGHLSVTHFALAPQLRLGFARANVLQRVDLEAGLEEAPDQAPKS